MTDEVSFNPVPDRDAVRREIALTLLLEIMGLPEYWGPGINTMALVWMLTDQFLAAGERPQP